MILSDLLNNPLLSDFEKFFQDFSELRQNFRNSLKSYARNAIPDMRFEGISLILSQLGEILKKNFSKSPKKQFSLWFCCKKFALKK